MIPMAEQEKMILTPEDVADLLKVSLRTVSDLIRSGEIPSFKVGRYRRVVRRDLDAYIQRKTQGTVEN